MHIGETIYRLRTEAGLSQSDLAEALGVSRQSISKWETGASVPDLDKLIKLRELFHVSLDTLVQGETEPTAEHSAAPSPPPSLPAPHTRTQRIGMGLIYCSIAAGLVLCFLFGLVGLLFVLPFLALGLICRFAEKHPALKALWTAFLLMDAYLCFVAGIRASSVILTFQWTQALNYLRLAVSWGLFLLVLGLVVGTAVTLRKTVWTGSVKQKCLLVLSLLCLVGTSIPIPLEQTSYEMYGGLLSFLFLGLSWARLWAVAVLACFLAQYLYARRHGRSHE